jgi:hypothetical protein
MTRCRFPVDAGQLMLFAGAAHDDPDHSLRPRAGEP